MKNAIDRKAQSERILQAKGIAVNAFLPTAPTSDAVQLKDFETVCRRAVTAMLSTQIARCVLAHKPQDVGLFMNLYVRFDVNHDLNAKETALAQNLKPDDTAGDIIWEYESFWALCWALGFIDDISDGTVSCDNVLAQKLVAGAGSLDGFMARAKLRDIEEILDMLDLYYRYHWAVVEQRIHNPALPVGGLRQFVVSERRRALEWLISPETDWFEIPLHT